MDSKTQNKAHRSIRKGLIAAFIATLLVGVALPPTALSESSPEEPVTTELDLLAQALNAEANSVTPDEVRLAGLVVLFEALVLEECPIENDRGGLCDVEIGTDESPLVIIGGLIGTLTGAADTPNSSTCSCSAGAKCAACEATVTCNGALQTANCTCKDGDNVCCKRAWYGRCKSTGRSGTCTATCTSVNAGSSELVVQDAVAGVIASLLSHQEQLGSRDALIQAGLPTELEASWEAFRAGFEGLTQEEQQAHIDGFAYHLLEAAVVGVISEQILGNTGEDIAGAWAYTLTHFTAWTDAHGIEPQFVSAPIQGPETQEIETDEPAMEEPETA